jgi:DNA-binding Lrp family transcriptional regulator
MDNKSKELLNLIQANFPLEARPFLKLANELNITEEQVIDNIKDLKDNGYIKRLGGIFDSKKLGYHSTLCAIKVPQDRIPEVAELINNYTGVTHNYMREHSYNMWFTVIADSLEAVKDFLDHIKRKTGIEDIIELPAVNLFKINVNFNIKE